MGKENNHSDFKTLNNDSLLLKDWANKIILLRDKYGEEIKDNYKRGVSPMVNIASTAKY